MINRFSLFLGGLGLFALQGCKTQQGEQAQLPNVIYVFPDQYRNQAMEFWGQVWADTTHQFLRKDTYEGECP